MLHCFFSFQLHAIDPRLMLQKHLDNRQYEGDEKIEEACYLLIFTNKTSIEIATDLSFSSHSYFISVFKKVKGMTPKEFRNQNKIMTEQDTLK